MIKAPRNIIKAHHHWGPAAAETKVRRLLPTQDQDSRRYGAPFSHRLRLK
jgi:hypothetical protein